MGVSRGGEAEYIVCVQEIRWDFIECPLASAKNGGPERWNVMSSGTDSVPGATWDGGIYDRSTGSQAVLVYLVANLSWQKEEWALALVVHGDFEG